MKIEKNMTELKNEDEHAYNGFKEWSKSYKKIDEIKSKRKKSKVKY